MKTKLEVIEETYKYYSEDPSRRSLSETGECLYIGDGKRCAFSRCCNEEDEKDLQQYEGMGADEPLNGLGYDILKPEYRHEDEIFWCDLQRFHDDDKNWNKKGLTSIGIRKYDNLKSQYS